LTQDAAFRAGQNREFERHKKRQQAFVAASPADIAKSRFGRRGGGLTRAELNEIIEDQQHVIEDLRCGRWTTALPNYEEVVVVQKGKKKKTKLVQRPPSVLDDGEACDWHALLEHNSTDDDDNNEENNAAEAQKEKEEEEKKATASPWRSGHRRVVAAGAERGGHSKVSRSGARRPQQGEQGAHIKVEIGERGSDVVGKTTFVYNENFKMSPTSGCSSPSSFYSPAASPLMSPMKSADFSPKAVKGKFKTKFKAIIKSPFKNKKPAVKKTPFIKRDPEEEAVGLPDFNSPVFSSPDSVVMALESAPSPPLPPSAVPTLRFPTPQSLSTPAPALQAPPAGTLSARIG